MKNKNWFKTKNVQILDLNIFVSFWIEEADKFYLFGCDEREIDWRIGEFENKDDAQTYLDEIYNALGNK